MLQTTNHSIKEIDLSRAALTSEFVCLFELTAFLEFQLSHVEGEYFLVIFPGPKNQDLVIIDLHGDAVVEALEKCQGLIVHAE